jgi:nucleoside-diphosphate-sugar epimerase
MTLFTMVTGGTGMIGGEVILTLARRGCRVRALVRADSNDHANRRLVDRLRKSDSFHPDLLSLIDAVPGDTELDGFGIEKHSFDDVRAIVHCAANTQFSEREGERVWQTNVHGARNLIDVSTNLATGARVMFLSTTSVTTAPESACVAEDTPCAGYSNMYTRSKREAERILRDAIPEAIIVRPSIVLSRGIRDRPMARSILWAVPIMGELGDIPIDPDAHIDIVPVDFVATAIVSLVMKAELRHGLYHISAGPGAQTFRCLREASIQRYPDLARIQPIGRHATVSGRARARLLRPLSLYLPFINADVTYANDRLFAELGDSAVAPRAAAYVPELIGLINLNEAFDEMYQP